MWATASAESQPRGFRLGLLVDVATGVLLVLLFAWMLEDQELRAIPYHLIFFVLILVYGYRVWPLPVTVGVVAAVTLMTGAVLVDQHRQGQLEEAEFAEVILMPMILAAMVWHARRRRQAQLALQRSLRAERDRVDAETQFLREAAHAIRNPIAVARGFLDLAEVAPRSDQDACRQTVRHELYRIDRIAAQLLDVAAHPDGALVDREVIDGSELARDALNRWRAVSDRRWVLDVSGPAWIAVAPDRLSDALDALVENALRFTNEEDSIRIVCRVVDDRVVLGVADSGPGVPEEQRADVFRRFFRTPAPDGSRGTGLGLAFVAAVAAESGGHAAVGQSAEGGARVYLELPRARTEHVPGRTGAGGVDVAATAAAADAGGISPAV